MPRPYQLVLRNPEGEPDDVLLMDCPDSTGFSYRGRMLRKGARIEVASGAIYVVLEQIEEDGMASFICEPL